MPLSRCFIKGFFFATNCVLDLLLLRPEFWKNVAHRFCHDVNKFGKEGLVETERASVADCATQNATQNITATFI